MTINSIKDLQKVIALCKKTGVTSIKIDNIELSLVLDTTTKAIKPRREVFIEEEISVPSFNGITTQAPTEDPVDMPDELSQEQLMYYSARPEVPGEQ